jgi:aminoglycoside phosphotransferase family enzyme
MKAAAARAFREEAALREKVAFLCDRRRLGRPQRNAPRTVEVIETHFAWVFLVGDRAYKLKKPVRQASMDNRSVASRERACRDELRLNRRLAPGVYLRVTPVRRARSGSPSSGPRVPIADWLIEMRRLPAARMLDHAIAEGAVEKRDLDRVARKLAAFFAGAERQPMSDQAYSTRLCRQIRRHARELAAPDLGLNRRRVREIEAAQLEFLVRRQRILAGRGSRLIEGHGDLRPEHVFVGMPSARDRLMRRACVIDCLEFDADLRRLDPAEEIAFLALECARLGAQRLAADLVVRYRRTTGDPAPDALIHFYMSRRAAVRAQIAAWHLRDEPFASEARKWRAQAHDYLRDASRHIRRALALSRGADAGLRGAKEMLRTSAGIPDRRPSSIGHEEGRHGA